MRREFRSCDVNSRRTALKLKNSGTAAAKVFKEGKVLLMAEFQLLSEEAERVASAMTTSAVKFQKFTLTLELARICYNFW